MHSIFLMVHIGGLVPVKLNKYHYSETDMKPVLILKYRFSLDFIFSLSIYYYNKCAFRWASLSTDPTQFVFTNSVSPWYGFGQTVKTKTGISKPISNSDCSSLVQFKIYLYSPLSVVQGIPFFLLVHPMLDLLLGFNLLSLLLQNLGGL